MTSVLPADEYFDYLLNISDEEVAAVTRRSELADLNTESGVNENWRN
jgi:hypothetical protein